MIYIPPPHRKSIGGPTTFIKNLLAYLIQKDYPFSHNYYLSTSIFFSAAHNWSILKHFRNLNGAIIQRLDGIYYPSQHGTQFKEMNKEIYDAYRNYSNRIIFQSQYSRSQCFEIMGKIEEAKYVIIHNGVDRSVFYPGEKGEFARCGIIKFVTTGNIRKKAMVVPIVNALDKIAEKYPIRLMIVGEVTDPCLLEHLNRNYIQAVGAQSSQKVAEILRESDIFLHSQLNDNCPNAVLEAISSGLPIVGFDSGSMSELCFFSKDLLADIPFKIFHEYEDFKWEALMEKIEKCIDNYAEFRIRAINNQNQYDFSTCGMKYLREFTSAEEQCNIHQPPLKYQIKGKLLKYYRNLVSSN